MYLLDDYKDDYKPVKNNKNKVVPLRDMYKRLVGMSNRMEEQDYINAYTHTILDKVLVILWELLDNKINCMSQDTDNNRETLSYICRHCKGIHAHFTGEETDAEYFVAIEFKIVSKGSNFYFTSRFMPIGIFDSKKLLSKYINDEQKRLSRDAVKIQKIIDSRNCSEEYNYLFKKHLEYGR